MPPSSTFRFADLLVQLSGSSRLVSRSDLDREFSDHMLEVEWTVDNGWGTPYICPLHSLSLHPAAQVMHYAIELFEDMKAYRGIDDRIRLFRPDRHIHRMLRSIRRAALPVSLPNLQSRQNRSGRISLGRQNWSGLDKTSPAGRTSVGLPKPVRPD
ncbi:Branched-chain-amino-acid aminotransferase, cytosolic [Lamellibrachia satsuma]|nr:Branched-chain-amino-acid aminotransferase, cytosolic [Lamellibrachia satsuma]